MSKEIEVSNWLGVKEFAEKHGFAVRLRGSLLDSEGEEIGYVDMRAPEEEHYRIVIENEEMLSADAVEETSEEMTAEEEEEIPEEPSLDFGEELSPS